MVPLLYLHGFASSPLGTKITALRKILEPEGFVFHAPDLNVPSFAKLNYESVVKHAYGIARKVSPRVIVGSSLGALMALDVVRRGLHAPLVLIAPAVGVADQWKDKIPAGDPVKMYNYAEEREMLIHRSFFNEIAFVRPDSEPPAVPVRIIMGRNDQSVPFDRVSAVWERWRERGVARGSKFTEIADGDHSLTANIDVIAREIRAAAAGGDSDIFQST